MVQRESMCKLMGVVVALDFVGKIGTDRIVSKVEYLQRHSTLIF